MWSDLAVVGATLSCAPPFSFYFDLIEKVWKARDANTLPLHRLCTLARKQGARTVVIEPAAQRERVAQEISELDRIHGGGGAAEAIAISFFACDIAPDDDLTGIDQKDFLGQAIIVNYRPPASTEFAVSYVFEAILPPPSLSREEGGAFLLNNYLASHRDFECTVRAGVFKVQGIYYCQQNSLTHVCAHACLRMVMRQSSGTDLTSKSINTQLGITPPCQGLELGQIVSVIEAQGFEAEVTDVSKDDTYISLLASIIESGDQALLVVTTGHKAENSATQSDLTGREEANGQGDDKVEEHVVLVFGHTRHSDEWHPQAIPVYAGPGSAEYLQASAWIDHFLIHDDNLGPYYTLSSQALEKDPDVTAHWVIAIRAQTPKLTAPGAEAIAAVMLTNMLPVLTTSSSGRWFDYMTQNTWKYVLRTVLVTREDYIAHLASARAHDESAASAEELAVLSSLPDRVWMVEYSLPSLFTGNRAKLGEVLLMADPVDPSEYEDVFVGLRLPTLFVVRDAQSQEMVQSGCSLSAHSPLYRRTTCGVEW